MKFLSKLIFFIKRPKVVMIAGRGKETAREAIDQVLKNHFKIGEEVLIVDRDFEFFIKHSRLPILVITHVGQYHPDKEFFAGELNQVSETVKMAEKLPPQSHLILNFDDETVREIKNKSRAHPLTFGFGMRAGMRATDIVLTDTPAFGTNFKINYQGNIVPIWLENLFGKEQIYSALAAAAVGEVLDLNLVEVSEALKSYQGVPGRMRLIKGIKNSWVLDNSTSNSVFSVTEALGVLGKIDPPPLSVKGGGGRKIAVLGDVLGIGKYTIEAHEAIGEQVPKAADLLFTFGARAKFITQGAQRKGMNIDKVFQYDTVEAGKTSLRNEIREGDFVLIAGIKSEMEKILKEVMLMR